MRTAPPDRPITAHAAAGTWKSAHTFDIRDEHGLMPTLGDYRVCHELGSGMTRSTVYLAEHVETSVQAALKWPVEIAEVTTMTDIGNQLPCYPGLPVLLATGVYRGSAYFVMELLGSELLDVFQCLALFDFEHRWQALRVIGRLMLRRLWAIHRCGYVHGDVAPHNVLMGYTGSGDLCPCIVDFGCARPFPGGGPVPGHVGSQEYSSARSAEGGERLPVDDIEALGWILVAGIFGELPWFQWLEQLYKLDRADDAWKVENSRVTRQVQDEKSSLLNQGWDSLGPDWDKFTRMPTDLDSFIHVGQASAEAQATLDYPALFQILGGEPSLGEEAAEQADVQEFRQFMAPLLEAAEKVKMSLSPQGLAIADCESTEAAESLQTELYPEGFCRDSVEWPPQCYYAPGQTVHVWSASKNVWLEDGVVQNMLHQDCLVEDELVPMGSVQVVFDSGADWMWVSPEDQQQLLAPREACEALLEQDIGEAEAEEQPAEEEETLQEHVETGKLQEGLIPCSFCDEVVCTAHPAICESCWPLWLAEGNEEDLEDSGKQMNQSSPNRMKFLNATAELPIPCAVKSWDDRPMQSIRRAMESQ